MPSPSSTVLGSVPLRTLGGLGFAAYLVHWPLFLLLDEDRLGFGGPLLFLRTAGGHAGGRGQRSPTASSVRHRVRLPGPRLAVALGLVLVVVGAAAFVLPQQPPPASASPSTTSGPGDLDVVVPPGDAGRVDAVVGGSLAGSLNPRFEAWNAAAPTRASGSPPVATDYPLSAPGPMRLAGADVGEDTACVGFGPRLPHLLDAPPTSSWSSRV